ncbi:TnsD family Tn7-like transposition protein [Hylemonella sp. W303a]|uniref:TnsD family Tn7-like transposition protein n=1 Tax=Hylemonella sp. W303a TaxID=3389873 RepID=UPI00396B27D4
MSVNKAAMPVGLDVSTAIYWAKAAGIKINRKPKTFIEPLRLRAIDELKGGADKTDVATRAGVSRQSIEALLYSELGLHEQWWAIRHAAAQARMRQVWLDARTTHPTLATKYLRNLYPSAYSWLYAHDRDWLQAHKPERVKPLIVASKVRWDERDREFCEAVEKAVLELTATLGPKKPKLWQICQAVPDLRPKLYALDRLPLMRRAIDLALQRKPKDEGTNGELFPS